MSRLEVVKEHVLSQNAEIYRTDEKILDTLRDINISLACMVDIFNEVKNQEEKPKPKEPVEKTCETCMCDPNCKADVAMACGHCYEYSEWEGFEC